MVKVHTTLDLDRDLLRDAAETLGTTRTHRLRAQVSGR